MFKLIRRISYSVIPRPDRPWEEDPTSNAPTRRKRRISSTEPETRDDQEHGNKKKRIHGGDSDDDDEDLVSATDKNGDSATPEDNNEDQDRDQVQVRREGSVEVKSVTKGVKEVELDDKPSTAGTEDAEDSHSGSENAIEEGPDAGEEFTVGGTTQEGDVVVHPESIPLPDEDDESDELASSSPSPVKEDPVISFKEDETTTDTRVEVSRETITGESTITATAISVTSSSPEKRPPPRTRASTSPRKLPSQSPQKLFTTA